MNKEKLIKKVAKKIYHITDKDDSRTVQNQIDAEEIVNVIFEYCKEEKTEGKPKKGRKTKKLSSQMYYFRCVKN
jgi:nucleoid DNA-binding protein